MLSLGPEVLPGTGFGRGGIKWVGPDGGRRLDIEDVAVDHRGRILLFGGATRPRDASNPADLVFAAFRTGGRVSRR